MTEDRDDGSVRVPVFDEAGRIELRRPGEDALQAAGETVLGPEASEALLEGGVKVFRGSAAHGAIFVRSADEDAGRLLTAADPEVQDAVMAAAREVERSQAELRRADYTDPAKNPMIGGGMFGDD